MEVLTKERGPLRTAVTMAFSELDRLLKTESPKAEDIRVQFRIFEDKCKRLFDMDGRIEELKFQTAIKQPAGASTPSKQTEEADEVLTKDRKKVEHYRELHCIGLVKYEDFMDKMCRLPATGDNVDLDHNSVYSHASDNSKADKTTKLPKLKLEDFDGDLRHWTRFWNSFQKVDNDSSLTDDSKIAYLLQCMKPGTIAMEVMEIFPTSGEHYQEAKEYLKTTFGNKCLLVEMHARDILKLAFSRVLNRDSETISLRSLLYKLQAHIRALEQLGFKREEAGFLYPLVEATLPDELLRKWGSSRDNPGNESILKFKLGTGPPPPPKDSYDKLEAVLNFLQLEVQGEIRVEHSKSFTNFDESDTGKSSQKKSTAAALVSTQGSQPSVSTCIFCKSPKHPSQNCAKAAKMSLSERTKFLADNRCCFRCLKPGHSVRQNKCGRIPIVCPVCQKAHYALLCKQFHTATQPDTNSPQNTGVQQNTVPPSSRPATSTTPPASGNRDRQYQNKRTTDNCSIASVNDMRDGDCNDLIVQQTLQVWVTNGSKRVVIRIFLDEGCERSYILTRRASEIGLRPVGSVTLTHGVFGGGEFEITHDIYKVTLRSLNNNFKTTLSLLGQEKICGHVGRLPSSSPLLDKLRRQGISLTDTGDGPLDDIVVLLGANTLPRIYTANDKKITDDLMAKETVFGWTLLGKGVSPAPSCRSYFSTSSPMDDFRDSETFSVPSCRSYFSAGQIENLWDLGCLGIRDSFEVQSEATKQANVLQSFQDNLRINADGRYRIRLPWREYRSVLDSNENIAYQRLLSTTRNLLRDNRFAAYDNVLKEWESMGIIESVDPRFSSGPIHYLPHRGVYRASSDSTKLRPVFDASCKDKFQNSLNSCLETGPNMIEHIPDIITRFRLRKIGFSADISKAFYQIEVAEEDRDMLRFLWWEDHQRRELKTYRHCRVVPGLNCGPFLLSATLQHHFAQDHKYYPETIATLSESFYVDDLAASRDSTQEYNAFREEAKTILRSAQFELTKWKTNAYPPDNDDRLTTILGIPWDLKEDTISCSSPDVPTVPNVTKRILLSVANSLYDPLGLFSPGTLTPRLLIQQAWRNNHAWDEPLAPDLQEQFFKWVKTVNQFSLCQIPRYIGATPTADSELHVFCDASQAAYAACAFIRIEIQGQVVVQLLRASNRVAPLKKQTKKKQDVEEQWMRPTIPRLELLAALIGARLAANVLKSLKLDLKVTYWSDSKTVLCWIKCSRPWSVFVQNRVNEIRKLSNAADWHHVQGPFNPADLPSRGCDAPQLLALKWWEGPVWLKDPPETWPTGNIDYNSDLSEINGELRKTAQDLVNKPNVVTDPVIEHLSQRFLFFTRIVHAKAWFNRAVDHFLTTIDRMPFTRHDTTLLPYEIKLAEVEILRFMQRQLTAQELAKFVTFVDENALIRIQSRIFTATIDEFNSPYLIPQCELAERIVYELHLKAKHAGVQTLLLLVRDRFWIINARRLVKQIVHNCIICRKLKAKAANTPPAPLPPERTTLGPVFYTTGVDLAGPLYLRGGEKVWITLFTCAVYRAVHLDLVMSQSTECFVLALRRFISRRGRMNNILSDHGGNFEGTEHLLRCIDVKALPDYIKWKFIPPKAPWWGGFWERLIKCVKDLLKRNLGHASLDYEELLTLLCEVENILNSRPLTYVNADNDDLQPLTPAHFLRDLPDGNPIDLDMVADQQVRTRAHYLQQIRRNIKERFRREYLALLIQTQREGKSRPLQPGDIVLVESDKKKRVDWRLGRILRTIPGIDGEHRVAEVKTAKKNLVRPFQKLYPLEISQVSPLVSPPSTDERQTDKVSPTVKTVKVPGKSDERPPKERVSPSSHPQPSPVKPPVVTRTGRSVKPPVKLDLFSNSPLLKVNDFFVF